MEKMSNTFSCPIWPNPFKWLMKTQSLEPCQVGQCFSNFEMCINHQDYVPDTQILFGIGLRWDQRFCNFSKVRLAVCKQAQRSRQVEGQRPDHQIKQRAAFTSVWSPAADLTSLRPSPPL